MTEETRVALDGEIRLWTYGRSFPALSEGSRVLAWTKHLVVLRKERIAKGYMAYNLQKFLQELLDTFTQQLGQDYRLRVTIAEWKRERDA